LVVASSECFELNQTSCHDVAESGWLANIPGAFAVGGSNVGCVGGKILPIWGAPRPTWLHDILLGYVSVVDWSQQAMHLHGTQEPFGASANVIYERQALLRAGGFSMRLGRKGSRLLSNEEILVHHQLKRLGYTIYYDPKICVRHHVPADRLTTKWFKRRAYWQSVSDALLEAALEPSSSVAIQLRRLRRLASLAKHPQEIATIINHGNDAASFLRAFQALREIGYGTAGLHLTD
jgi:glucosyl-dolichyl phosphate glucuronosyltransferase